MNHTSSQLPSFMQFSGVLARSSTSDIYSGNLHHWVGRCWRSINDVESHSTSSTPSDLRKDVDRSSEAQTGRILIVEDESIVAMDIRNTLQHAGHVVAGLVNSGHEAILQARMNLPDVILMDIRLRGTMDGIEAAEIISLELNIPIIFMTAQADAATRNRAELTKPAGYLIKPFIPNEMTSLLKMILCNHS